MKVAVATVSVNFPQTIGIAKGIDFLFLLSHWRRLVAYLLQQ